MGSMLFIDPQGWSSILATLQMLQPQAFGSLNCVEHLASASNYYLMIENEFGHTSRWTIYNTDV